MVKFLEYLLRYTLMDDVPTLLSDGHADAMGRFLCKLP